MGGNTALQSGTLTGFDAAKWHNVRIAACYDDVTVTVDGETLLQYHEDGAGYSAGRAALYSSYHHCCFRNLRIAATDAVQPYVQTRDNCDRACSYSAEGWSHSTTDSFKSYKRTVSKGTAGASAEIEFEGTGILLTGEQDGSAAVSVTLDGELLEREHEIPAMSHRQTFLSVHGSEQGKHTLKITVLRGVCAVDAAQILYDRNAAGVR